MKKTLIFALTATLVAALFAAAPAEARKTGRLTILHVNDTHSHLEPDRSGKHAGLGGTIERAAYVDSIRKAEGRSNVLLLHAGDFNQGTPYFNIFAGDIEARLVQDLGYDAVALGNHEFDNGLDELARRLKMLKKPAVVCANYDFSAFELGKYVRPYVILRRGGLKIGIIGVLTDVSNVVSAETARKIKYLDPAEITNRYAKMLKEEKGCDLVLCLSHLGLTPYYESYCDTQLAADTRNVDAIVGGHSHTWIPEPTVIKNLDGKDVIIVQDWEFGYQTGKLTITY